MKAGAVALIEVSNLMSPLSCELILDIEFGRCEKGHRSPYENVQHKQKELGIAKLLTG